MKKFPLNSKGFGLLGVLAIVLIVAIAGFSGWFIWNKNHDTKKTTDSSNTNSSNKDDDTATDPYEGWLAFSNAKYGITFRYPTNWKVDEGTIDSPDSATKQEYAVSLKRNEDVKYNDTASLEILGEDMSSAAVWYDDYFAQSAESHVSKSSSVLKGKPATSYSVMNSGTIKKLYLFSVDNKTYVFSSINESSNARADSSYWTTFDKVFESLKIK